MKPKVSIITINYNNSSLTKDFLKSLQKYFPKDYEYEIIIVDNASLKEDYNNLKSIIQEVNTKVILKRSNINLGFGAGNMYGNQYANGKYLAFINNDIVFIEDCFSSLITFMEKHKTVGVCTPQQLNFEKKPTTCFDYFHGIRKELLGRWSIELFMPKTSVKRREYPYKKEVEVNFIQGCFMFFDKQKFNEIGGFDTNLFLYYEEMDTCYRLLKKGYSSYVVPHKKFLHLHGASTKKSDHISQELVLSKLYIYRKNYSFLKYKVLQLIITLKLLPKAILNLKKIKLLYIVLTGSHLKHSLKQHQKINS